jgi:hypothetical protein
VILLYSAISRLAYYINETYYAGTHYVWCAPNRPNDPVIPANALSSDPWQLYRLYEAAVKSDEDHSDIIKNNRAGIIRGATARFAQNMITDEARNTIEELATTAKVTSFSPLFMVIPFEPISHLATQVGLQERASLFSQEYIVADLPRANFDVWRWSD